MKERNFGVATVVSATGLLVCGLISFMWLRQNHRDWAAGLNTVTMVLTFVLLEVLARRDKRRGIVRPWFLIWPTQAARLCLGVVVSFTFYQFFR
jgi:cytochrome c biogenesis protein CcdA